MKTYQQVFDLIADYCNSDGKTLQLFADRWNRWPEERAAHAVISRIGTVARTFETTRPSIAAALTEAVVSIRNHIN